jgi:hypothetical protein
MFICKFQYTLSYRKGLEIALAAWDTNLKLLLKFIVSQYGNHSNLRGNINNIDICLTNP